VVITADGRLVGGEGHGAEVLAGQAAFLAMVAAELGKAFQAGHARFCSVQGTRHHLLLFAARSHYLCVLASPDSEVAAVEAAVRRALGGR
jgi:predicted regulator of Ras-like GTPase activity (Roadblock/LC7/MglB family)